MTHNLVRWHGARVMTPHEVVAEWRRGCSCAASDPGQCAECTVAAMRAVARWAALFAAIDHDRERRDAEALQRCEAALPGDTWRSLAERLIHERAAVEDALQQLMRRMEALEEARTRRERKDGGA